MTKKDNVQTEATEVVVQETQAVAETTGVARGMENADMSGMSLPRIIVMQPTSPALTADGSELRMGDLVNTLTLEKIPSNRFIPLMVWDSNILFTPRDEKPEDKVRLEGYGFTEDDFQQGNILCNAKDGRVGDRRGSCAKCGLNVFHGNVKPICNSTVNVLAKFDGVDMPMIIQFSVTSKKHGDKFKQMLAFSGGDIFKKAYKLTVAKKTAVGNKVWYEVMAMPAGNAEGDEYQAAEGMYKVMAASKAQWQHSEEYSQEPSTGSASTEEKEY